MVSVNGEKVNADNMNLSLFLEENGYNVGRIAVEMNGEILPKANYESTILKDGDVLEVVSFVAGG